MLGIVQAGVVFTVQLLLFNINYRDVADVTISRQHICSSTMNPTQPVVYGESQGGLSS